MANYATLKAAVADVVKTNGTKAITGANLQAVLLSIINSVGGGGYIFKGVATPSTSPGTPDENVFYLGGAGTYANFGTSITVPVGSIGVFKYNGAWTKEAITMFAGIDDVPTAGSDNLVKSGGVSVISDYASSNDESIKNYLNIECDYFKEMSTAMVSYRYDIPATSFDMCVMKINGNLSSFDIRAYNSSTDTNTTLISGCEFGKTYHVVIPTGNDKVFIYQRFTQVIDWTETLYAVLYTTDDSVMAQLNGVKEFSTGIYPLNKVCSIDTSFFKENNQNRINVSKSITPGNYTVYIHKFTGNYSTYSIRYKDSNSQSTILIGTCYFDTYYDVTIPSDGVELFIYDQSSASSATIDYYSTSYMLSFYPTDTAIVNLAERVETAEENIKATEFELTALKKHELLSGTGRLNIQYNLDMPSFEIKVNKLSGSLDHYSIRLRNADDTESITIEGNAKFGKAYTYYNVDISSYPHLFLYQNDTSGVAYQYETFLTDLTTNTDYLRIRQAQTSLGFVGKKILMLGDSITQLPISGTTNVGDGIVEYTAIKTGASVIRGAFGGSHLSARADLTGVTTITTEAQARAALDVVSIAKAISTGDFTLQDQADTFLSDTAYHSILSTIKSLTFSDIDIITIFAGTNDCNSSIAIGNDNSVNELELAGAINQIVNYLCSANKKLKVYFFTPCVRWWPTNGSMDWTNAAMWCDNRANVGGGGDGLHLYDYVDAVLRVGKKNHIPSCDLYYGLGWNIYNYSNFCNNNDGTHPVKGFDVLANKISSFILSNQ